MSRAKTCRAKFFNRIVIFTLSLSLFVSNALAAPPKYISKEYGALSIFKEIAKYSKLANETKARPEKDPKVVTQFVVENNYSSGLLTQHYKFKPITRQPRRIRPVLEGSAGIAIPLSDFDLSDEPYNPEGDGPTPRGGTPNFGSCPGGTGTLVAQVLAIEQTYGSGGPQVPARLDCQFVGGLREVLNGDQNLAVDTNINMPIPAEASEIVLWGRMAYPTFEDPYMYQEFPSNDPVNSMILVDGDHYDQIAASKGVQNPYGSQQSVAAVLRPLGYMSPNTDEITLAANQAIQLFELGTTNTASPAYDMQDLVLLLTTNCDIPQEIVLRDSIGTSSASTNGNYSFSSWQINGGGPTSNVKVTVEFTAPQNLTLSTVRVIASKTTPALNFGGIDYALRIWSSANAALANSTSGDIANIILDTPSSGPNAWGVTGSMPLIGVVTSYEMTFDISSQNIVVPSGQTRLLGIHALTNGCSTGQSGCLGILESNSSGSSDRQMGPSLPNGWIWIGDSSNSHYDGQAAWDLRAVAN